MKFLSVYRINGLNGREHFMTAKQIYKRVLKDIRSENDWIATVSELVRVCEEPKFPKDYKEKIEICILKYFANIEIYKKEKPKCCMQIGSDIAVRKCYNSIRFSKDENAIFARKKYFEAILDSVIHSFDSIQIPSYFKSAYKQICKNWKIAMFEGYFDDEPIKNIKRMKRLFKMELHDTIKKALNQENIKPIDKKKVFHSITVSESQHNSINKER